MILFWLMGVAWLRMGVIVRQGFAYMVQMW